MNSNLESLMRELIPRRMTGLLKITFDACDGFIILDEGEIVEGYEIFNKLLVRDRNGRHIIERYKAEPGKIDVYEVRPEALKHFLRTLEDECLQDFQAFFRHFCNKKGRKLLN